MKRSLRIILFLAVLALPSLCVGQVSFPKGSMSGPTTVAALPATGNSNIIYDVRDGNPGCASGGGTTRVACHWNGASYDTFSTGSSTPTAITVANEATDTTTFPLFVTAATGDLGPKTNSSFTFNSNTGALGATSFVGTGSGAGYLELPQGVAPSLGTTSVQIVAPTSVTSYKFTLPSAVASNNASPLLSSNAGVLSYPTGTPNGSKFLRDDGSWQTPSASITVGDTQVLFADGANTPAGDAGMTYNKTTDTLTLAGNLNAGGGTQAAPAITMGATNSGFYTPAPGSVVGLSLINSTYYYFFSDKFTLFSNNIPIQFGSGQDLSLSRSAASVLAVGNGTQGDVSGAIKAATATFNTLASDATHTDNTVCADTSTGLLYKGSGTAGICLGTSSERFKNHITDNHSGLAEILKLRPRQFFYNAGYGDSGGHLQYGFTAEETAKALPDLVRYSADGKPLSVDYLGMIMPMVKSIQQMNERLVALEKENKRLRRIVRRQRGK